MHARNCFGRKRCRLPEEPVPTRHEIALRLRVMATIMEQLAADMQYIGGFSAIGAHGVELAGAAAIARSWANGIQEMDDE